MANNTDDDLWASLRQPQRPMPGPPMQGGGWDYGLDQSNPGGAQGGIDLGPAAQSFKDRFMHKPPPQVTPAQLEPPTPMASPVQPQNRAAALGALDEPSMDVSGATRPRTVGGGNPQSL